MDGWEINQKLDIMLKNADEEYDRLDEVVKKLDYYADVVTAARVGLFILRDQITALKEDLNDGREG